MKTLINYINETLNKSYDLNKFIQQVKNKFDVVNSNFSQWEPGRYMIAFKLPFDENDKTLKSLLNLFNVFISEMETEDVYPENSVYVRFESKYSKEVTDNIYKYDKLYHLTRQSSVDKILKTGLQPRLNNKKSSKKKAYHPERVYCLSQEIDKQMIRKYASQLASTEIIVIDLKKLKEEYNTTLTFYKDPQSFESYSVYTDSFIRPEVLSKTTINKEFK